MKSPRGELTRAQLGIVEMIWKSDQPLTIGEVWQQASKERTVARSTIQTLIERLERRGWLIKEESEDTARYRAACSPEEATDKTVTTFVREHFDGSPSRLVMSLLGRGEISNDEMTRIRALLDDWEKEGSHD